MIEKAGEKQIYDRLEQGDLVEFLNSHRECYDVVTCAATLIHFSSLDAPFRAAAAALRNGGLFIFTLFPNEIEPDAVAVESFGSVGGAQGGCFMHGRNYIVRLAEAAGFIVEILDDEIHEYQGDKPQMGLVVALRVAHVAQ